MSTAVTIRNGRTAHVEVGDTLSGYTYGGRLVTGTVEALLPDDESVRITGITFSPGGEIRRGVWTVEIRQILTVAHNRALQAQ